MSPFDEERFDRTRVACLLLGEPEPPAPISSAPYIHPFIAFAAVDAWCYCDRPGSHELPSNLAGEFATYAALAGWHNDPFLVGLLTGLEHPGWHPESAILNLDANPYRVEVNRISFDNGRLLAKTAAGQRYRAYVVACRKEAAMFSPWMRIP